jgi:multidrug resistance efflux pump
MRAAFAVLLAIGPALAQEQEIQRALIQRQQRSDAFALQLRQAQERLRVAPGDLRRQQAIESRHLAERQRLENLNERQLREVRPDTPQELRPYERLKADEERRPLTVPAGETPGVAQQPG